MSLILNNLAKVAKIGIFLPILPVVSTRAVSL